jgi:predicted lipoprotein with Yx(FWY)xxD motif
MQRSPVVPALCVAAVVGFLAVATHANSEPARTVRGSAAPAASRPAPTPTKPAAPGLKLSVLRTKLGTVVVGPDGHTLYRSNKDSAKPPASNCVRRCVAIWPPLLGSKANLTVQGIDPALVGTFKRADGRSQLTLHGWPLYYNAKDKKPGDTIGDGAGDGVFQAIGPNGQPATAATPPTTPTTSPGSGDYGG